MFKQLKSGLIKIDHDLLKKTVFYYILSIFGFAAVYYLIYLNDATSFTSSKNKYSFFDFVHFSLVTQTTVGYGTMSPLSSLTKMINSIQLLTINGIIVLSML